MSTIKQALVEQFEPFEESPTREEAEEAVRTLIRFAGDNPDRKGLVDTPERVISAFDEHFAGYAIDPTNLLNQTFEETAGYSDVVTLDGIRFESHCEHHMAPIIGTATIGYIPTDRVVGISKLARVVDAISKRFQIQERMTAQIADAIDDALKPSGVGVIISAEHFCMTTRGIRRPGTRLVTSQFRGEFLSNPDLQNTLRQKDLTH